MLSMGLLLLDKHYSREITFFITMITYEGIYLDLPKVYSSCQQKFLIGNYKDAISYKYSYSLFIVFSKMTYFPTDNRIKKEEEALILHYCIKINVTKLLETSEK